MAIRKQFIPQEWIQESDDSHISTPPAVTDAGALSEVEVCVSSTASADLKSVPYNTQQSDVAALILQLQERQLDITSSYAAWRDIGFALSDEFGESGRGYYHTISHFHKDYNYEECNKQYNNCLKAKGHGVSIKTLFHYAKEAGIVIHSKAGADLQSVPTEERSLSDSDPKGQNCIEVSEVEGRIFDTPQIPNSVYEQLPQILKESTDLFEEGIERDVFFIGALGVLSACIPNVVGYYFDEPVSAHLYAFITAPAGSGKGKLKWAKQFANGIHKAIVEQSSGDIDRYELEMENYNNLNRNQKKDAEKPQKPKRKMFFIPANSSSAAFIQALSDNDFKGLIFETEADTLAGTLQQDWGNFSDVLRKAFHHESTNMFRRKDSEYIEIEDPHLAIALSGTPKQVHNMMPDTENGLFSRFLYYAFEDYSNFKNPFISHSTVDYETFFEEKGQEVKELYNQLKGLEQPLRFTFTAEQGSKFTSQFNTIYKRNRTLMGNDFNANSRRLGIIAFRLAMLLRTLRILEDGDTTSPLLCSEVDYTTAIDITLCLEKHAIAVYQNLPKQEKLKGVKQDFYNALPNTFNRQEYLKVASTLNIIDKTAQKYIGIFKNEGLLNHTPNKYTKITT